jgi:hypothetical protein
MLIFVFRLHQHILDVYFYILPNLIVKHPVHQSLVGCPYILQTERHKSITKDSFASDEARLLLIIFVLIIT